MSKRGSGVAFIAIAAILFSAKYISAAIFGSGVSSWDEGLFNVMLSNVGTPLNTYSLISLGIGIVYIAWGEYEEFVTKKQ